MTPILTPWRRTIPVLTRRLVSLALVLATLSAFVAVGGAAALRLTGRQIAVVLSGSMTPQFVAGDAVIVKPAPKPSELRVGEIVTFHGPGEARLTTHRIHALIHRPDGLYIQTKGDANRTPDPNFTPAANVVGVAGTVIPNAGRFVLLYTDPLWRLITLGIPLLIVLLYHTTLAVRELWPTRQESAGDDGAWQGQVTAATPRRIPGLTPAPKPVALARARRRAITLALTVAAVLGVSAGTTGAVFADSTTTTASFTTAASFCGGATAYDAAVNADSPDYYWPHGSVAADARATYTGVYTLGQVGAWSCSPATRFGATGALSANAKSSVKKKFTMETWFKSSTTLAGQIIGEGNKTASQGNSTNRDRVLYVDSSGHAAYRINTSTALTSPSSIVDGQWHYLAVTYSKQMTTLYVDGQPVASVKPQSIGHLSGYWRVGNDSVTGLPGVTGPSGLTATLDNTAIYLSTLTAAQITSHYTAAGR